jgi:RloB-like protein
MAKKGKVKKFQDQESEERPVRFRRYQYLFLIVCEDENTEPLYFKNFKEQIPNETIYLRPVGTGRDAKGVVEEAIKEKHKLAIEAKKEVDVVWAVFDKDDADENVTKIQRFADAFDIAEKNKIKAAYSNEVFELWLLLHLTDVDSTVPLPRKTIYDLLQTHIQQNENYSTFHYKHGNGDILTIINTIGNQQEAIRRAEILLQKHKTNKPIQANPSTKVHLLVKELLEWIAYFSYKPDK